MLNIFQKYKKSRFFRNVLIVASGTAGAQLISVVFSPVITRLYGPEAFGILGIFLAITHMISPLGGLAYQYVIVLPKDDAEADGLFRAARLSSFVIAIIMFFVIFFAGQFVTKFLQAESIGNFIYLIPVTLVFAAYSQSSQQMMLRKKMFKSNAKITIVQTLFVNGLKSIMGLFYPVASVLIWITTLDNGILACMQTLAIKKRKNKEETGAKVPLGFIMKKYYDCPLFRMPHAIINYSAPGIPVLLISSFFGPAAAGFYSLGRKVLSMTTSLIGRSVGNVFYPHMAEAANLGKNIMRPHRKATAALALVGIIPFGSVFIAGPWLFAFVFGEDWIKAGEYARWIALWTYMVFVSNPSNLILVVFSMQKLVLLFEVVQIGLLVCGLCIGFYIFANDVSAIMLFCVMDSILCLGLIVFAFIKVRQWETRKNLAGQKTS